MKGHRFVCVFPSPGRIVAPIVVIFGTRVLCRPGKVIGYRERSSLRSRERSEQNECAKRTSSPAGLAGGPAKRAQRLVLLKEGNFS